MDFSKFVDKNVKYRTLRLSFSEGKIINYFITKMLKLLNLWITKIDGLKLFHKN